MTTKELIKLHKEINKKCLDIAIQRGKDYNKDGNMIGSYGEYNIDDIASIIKIKAIRIKHNPKIAKRECPDIINYCIEILRRFK